MAYIESHQQLLTHPKTLDLMSLMGWDIDTTIGKLQRFWWWCLEYAPEGDLRRHNAARLGAAVGLPVDQAEKFVSAMVQARFLDTSPYFRVHDWWRYVGPFLQVKYKRYPKVWQRVKNLYQDEYSDADSSQDDRCSAPGKGQMYPCSNRTSDQESMCSTGTDVQCERHSVGDNVQDGTPGAAQSNQSVKDSTGASVACTPRNSTTESQKERYSTGTIAQNGRYSNGTNAENGRYNNGTSGGNGKYSNGANAQNGRTGNGAESQSGGYSTGENVQMYRYCPVPSNQSRLTKADLTKPDITISNQTNQQQPQQHQQPRADLFQVAAGIGDGDYRSSRGTDSKVAFQEQLSVQPGRHQQQPSPIPPLVEGAVADTAGPGERPPTRPPGSGPDVAHGGISPATVRAGSDQELERILYDRIGRRIHLSRMDMEKIEALLRKHGPAFLSACDSLHSGVTNPAAYLTAILEPGNALEELAKRFEALALGRGSQSGEKPELPDD